MSLIKCIESTHRRMAKSRKTRKVIRQYPLIAKSWKGGSKIINYQYQTLTFSTISSKIFNKKIKATLGDKNLVNGVDIFYWFFYMVEISSIIIPLIEKHLIEYDNYTPDKAESGGNSSGNAYHE